MSYSKVLNYIARASGYRQWAAIELLERIMDRPFEDAETAIEEFILEMTVYAHYGKGEKRSLIFKNAAEVGEELLLLFEE